MREEPGHDALPLPAVKTEPPQNEVGRRRLADEFHLDFGVERRYLGPPGPVDRRSFVGPTWVERNQHHHGADVKVPDRLPELPDRVLAGALGHDDRRLVTHRPDQAGVDVGPIGKPTSRQPHAVLVIWQHILATIQRRVVGQPCLVCRIGRPRRDPLELRLQGVVTVGSQTIFVVQTQARDRGPSSVLDHVVAVVKGLRVGGLRGRGRRFFWFGDHHGLRHDRRAQVARAICSPAAAAARQV